MANRWDRIALASVLAGVIVRIIWGLVIHPPLDYLYSDMGAYVERAQRLAMGAGLQRSDAFFPPGTHILLAAPMTLFGTERAGLWGGAVLWCATLRCDPVLRVAASALVAQPARRRPDRALLRVLAAVHHLWRVFHLRNALAGVSASFPLGRLPGRPALGQEGRLARPGGRPARRRSGRQPSATHPEPRGAGGAFVVSSAPPGPGSRRHPFGIALILAGTALHNSAAAGKPTGLSENAGLNFWIGQCDVHDVTTVDPARNITFHFGNPVWAQLGRGGTYYFEGPLVWDQGFFYEMGLRCIERDGLGHVRVLARNVLNMSATTVPWPQVNEAGQRGVVRLSNLAYSLLLPLIVIDSLFVLIRRPASGRSSGEVVMLLQLACALLVAIFFFGDPRVRSSYDVFGLALLAARITDRFGLEESREKPPE